MKIVCSIIILGMIIHSFIMILDLFVNYKKRNDDSAKLFTNKVKTFVSIFFTVLFIANIILLFNLNTLNFIVLSSILLPLPYVLIYVLLILRNKIKQNPKFFLLVFALTILNTIFYFFNLFWYSVSLH